MGVGYTKTIVRRLSGASTAEPLRGIQDAGIGNAACQLQGKVCGAITVFDEKLENFLQRACSYDEVFLWY
jgi:hypothetical protein